MSALTLVAVFGFSLAIFCTTERVLHSILVLFGFGHDKDSKDLQAGLVVGAWLNVLSTLLSSAVSLAARCVGLFGWLLFWYALFYLLTSVWYVMYEDYPRVVIYIVDFYGKRVGPFLHGYLFMPLDIFNILLKGFLPVYNGVLWILRGLLSKGLLPVFLDQLELLVDMGVALLGLGKGVSVSMVDFVFGVSGCKGMACVDRPAELDLLTPMGGVRDLAVVVSRLGGAVCSTVSQPIDFALYMLVDARFAKGLHSLVNSLLHLVVHVPRSAVKRCDAYGKTGKHWSVLMCTPDLAPAFDRAVSGLRDLGGAVDNWLGVGAAMARRSLKGLPDDCSLRSTGPDRFRRGGVLSGVQTTVGLTDWLMSASNGSHAYFWGQVTSAAAVRLWPEPVDVRMGLAAVAFDEAGEVEISGVTQGQRPASRQTTSLLGCRCLDTSDGLVVRCSVLPLQGGASASTHAFDVLFQDRTWARTMRCASAEVSVRSVRWPVRRYEGKSAAFSGGYVDVPEADCMSRGSCESVDATIWLVPRCDALAPEQCSDAAVGTSCFPFCMAARVYGSRNANPVFVNSETWRSGRQLLMRDCALQSPGASAGLSLGSPVGSVYTLGYGETTLSGAAGGAGVFVSGSGDGSGCSSGPNLVSWAPLPASSVARDSRSIPATVRRRGQPFVLAGDALLMEFASPDGASTVEVDRLSGNQRDVYSLVPGWAGLPTAPKLLVPVQELASDERARVTVPMDWATTRVPSTSSRNYVFYAVSPDLRIFEAYLEYCRDSSSLPRAQYMMLSSYSALRVYRVRAYCQETCEAGDLTAQFTFDGFSDGKFTPADFPQDCSRVYNASIDALEYVNEQNLAVTVQVADRTYSPLLREGSNSTYVTYWLNPQTMRAKTGEMWATELPSSLTAGLCVVADGVPHLGALGAEVGVAGLHLLHRGLGAFLYMPGMLSFWKGGSACPLESRGHSVLASCGRSVLDLDDFFDSLDSAAAVLWGMPGWVAEQLEQGKVVNYSPVSDLLRGLGEYGKGAVGVSALQGGVLSLLNTPLPEQLAGVYALVRQPGALSGTAKVVGGATSWARFSARFFAVVGAAVAEKLAVSGSLELGELWRDFVGALYDHRPLFKSAVTDRGLSACLGLEMMVGGANPAGRLLYHSCLSSVRVVDGFMELFLRAFADAPMVKCVCKDSEGRAVGLYAREHCVGKAPKTMQPTLLGMIGASEGLIGGDALLCPAVIAYTRRELEKTMSPYFSTVFSSLDALGDSVDYLLSGFDPDAGQCSNFRSDPQVVVIMPEPVDYFRGCGATTYCRTRCAGNWEAFDEARARYDPARLTSSREIERTVDSLFFPTVVADMIAPGQVVALVRPNVCGAWVCRSEADDCLAVAAVVGVELRVSFFCVPSSPSSVVYLSESGGLPWASGVGHDSSRVSFLGHDGSSLLALLDGSKVALLRRGYQPKVVVDVGRVLSLPLAGMYPLRILDFLAVRQRLLVSVAVRTGKDGVFERDVSTLWVSPLDVVDPYTNELDYFPVVLSSPVFKDLWKGYAVSEYPSEDPGSAELLLWPVSVGATLRRATLTWTNASVNARLDPIQHGDSLVARATMIPRRLVLSKTLRLDSASGQLTVYVSAGQVYDWLRQLRLSGSGLVITSASLNNAQPVRAAISVATSCDGLDCRGCPDLALRSLCSAYQSCSVFRCIGTPVNLKRPLCGVGQALKSMGNVGVASVQGAWVMFVDIFMILLQLKTVSNLPGVDVTFPDDSFMGNVCAAKDVSAEFFSILTAAINSVLQRVQSVARLFSHFSAVDSSVHTAASLSMAAITGFLHQLALAPVYVLAVGHKVMMCQVSGFLAVASESGTHVSIQPARFSSTDAIGGQCLTVGAEVEAQQTGDSQAVRGIASHAGEILTGTGQAAVMKRLEPYMHVVDGALTYLIGAVAKFADVLQTTDLQHCVLPDVTLRSAVRCACGDQPLGIIQKRKREGLADFAYWCTGTISLVDGDNRVQVVWNPYTYEELQARVGAGLDDYAARASESVSAVAPNDPVFAEQGASMLAVLTRCRQNYINKQWDPAAFARYNQGVYEREVRGNVRVVRGDPLDGVGQCLLASVDSGAGNGACLDSFLRSKGQNSLYWGYDVPPQNVSSHLLDACLVFSGPASNVGVSDARRKPFQDCLGGYGNQSSCDLSGFVWSPSSSNDVPVAVRHVINSGNGSHLADAVERRMAAASEMVMAKLQELANYSNDGLRAALFSAEGDVIHQLMDCVFMGPYARVDYWPVPRCDESEREDCLVGPYWSRDEGRGKTRKVDPDTCDAAKELPFTCGSPTRKAMVKDFVEQYLEEGSGGADVVEQLVRGWLQQQAQVWYYDPQRFSCACQGCCDGYLPRSLSTVSLQVSTQGIMNALGDRLSRFYRAAMGSSEPWVSQLDAAELAKYNWTASAGSAQVKGRAAFHPSKPTQRYDESEAGGFSSDYSMSLWRVCHSALRQVLFTMPVSDDGLLSQATAVPAFSGGGPEAIAEHVRRLVAAAKDSSPLFRHYHPRHHPSSSRVCNGSQSRDARVARGSVRFSDYAVRGNVILSGDSLLPISTLGYDAGSLGGSWQGGSPGLNEHLGFLDRDATESWLRGEANLTTSGEFLLRYGAGGLKVGNAPGSGSVNLGLPEGFAADLHAVLRDQLSESDRAFSVQSAVLHGCEDHKNNVSDLLVRFVDGLFPMAQGVVESGAGSYCLRFALELAMLYAMEMYGSTGDADVIAQKELAVTWQRKCGTQVQLVGMCSALDLYHYMPMQASCMYSWYLVGDSAVEMYLTPDCLVKIGDKFYDPCQCRPDWCEERNTTQVIRRADLENSECKLGFDPRGVIQAAELGWWGEDESDPSATAWNSWLEEPVNLLDMSGFRREVLSGGQAAGNSLLGQHWSTSEGFMNETGAYCDMVADYWPDDSAFPVGYHVTTPCYKDDAGYRSFDNVFALETDAAGNPRLAYMEDQTREADLVDSHFGAGGLCRGTNFAMDMYETNTMRVCTRLTSEEYNGVDMHVPLGNSSEGPLGLPRCSQSSTELPWADDTFYDYYDPAFYSVGTVPNLPSMDAALYPESGDRYMFVGPQHQMKEEGWGEYCQDFELPSCLGGAWRCPEGYVCRSSGVCQHPSVQCTGHYECPGSKMCSGLGTCEDPVVSVDNQLGEELSFRAHTADCAGEAFSMLGASYWGYVPDLLEAHGMCSYRHWQEYLYTMDRCCNGQSGRCSLKASTCPFYKFSKDVTLNKWWNDTDAAPTRMKMIPTTCDRDYERFKLNGKEMKSCVPSAGKFWLLKPDGTYQQAAARDKLWKVYDDPSRTVSVLLMPNRSQPGNGFLSVSSVDGIKSCMSIRQCFSDVFTKNGRPSMVASSAYPSPNRTVWNGGMYDPNDQFRCGVIGYYDQSRKKCLVDLKLFPIYYVLCKEEPRVGLGLCQASLKTNTVPARCDEVRYEYDPEYSAINDVNVPALNKFFYAFEQPTTLAEHMELVGCVNYIYSVMSGPMFGSRGLYVPFTFTLYEIPFAWFYQCMVGSGVEIDHSLERKLYACTFYQSRVGVSTTVNAYPQFRSFVFNVRGGYVRATFEVERARQAALMSQAWENAVEQVRALLFQGSSGVDLTYPQCYSELHWALPSDNRFKRKMIEAYVRNTCASNTLSTYIARYNQETKKNVDTTTGIFELVNLAGPLVRQEGGLDSRKLLTGLIKSFGADWLSQQTSSASIKTDLTPVRLDHSLPALDSVQFSSAKTQWRQLAGVMPNQVDIKRDEPNSGVLKYVYVDPSGNFLRDEDTDQQSGADTWVQVWSVYARGYFRCFYPDLSLDGKTLSLKGNDTSLEQNFDEYVGALYGAVKRRYEISIASLLEAKTVGPIPMSALPFYEDESGLGFGSSFQFDLKGVANYMSNINPDIRTPVMCVAGNQQVDFNRCSDPNFAALKQHVFNTYSRDGGLVVPDRNQLDWIVSKEMMSGGAIFSFASTGRNLSKRFINRMFDDDTVCGASSTLSSRDKLCYFEATNALAGRRVLAPWLGGGWNPFDKCDVKQLDLQSGNAEVVDSLCYYEAYCPSSLGVTQQGNPYYLNMPNPQCSSRDNERTNNINVNARFLYNLCKHRLNEDSVCNHTQGMLGGSDGSPMEDYDVDGGLFSLHNFSKQPAGTGKLFGSVLYSGGDADYGFLKMEQSHIGGHHIGLHVLADGSMRVSKLPLKPIRSRARVSDWDTLETGQWVPSFSRAVAADDLEYLKSSRDVGYVQGTDANGRPLFGWDCPLRRRAFYTGGVENFKPQLPSSRRSRRIFSGLTGESWAHPTQQRQDGSKRFGGYKTTNGFCFCPTAEEVWPGMCSVDTRLRDEHNCSLYRTVQALRGGGWGWSHTFRPRNRQNEFKTCRVQVDWPFVEGYLRDNATVGHGDVDASVWAEASDVEERKCHVLDRAPNFAYTYVSRRELRRSGFTTLARGACHTGRVQRRLASDKRCVRSSKGTLNSTLRCSDNSGAGVERRRSLTPPEAASTAKLFRRRCGRCTPPPQFVTRAGQPIPAESSFGLPYRVSAERVLARDLREALCRANESGCSASLNASAWRKGEFLRALLEDPRRLFKRPSASAVLAAAYEPRRAAMPDNSRLWAGKWVYCPTRESLRTSQGCNGSIDKARWRANKVGACYSTILDALKGKADPFASTDICNLDSRLGELCVAIREAQSIVSSTNCIRSGDERCSMQEFVYNPSTWESSNQAFVHQTVQEFYVRADGCTSESDCVCKADSALEQLRRNNSYRLRKCSAVSVMVFRDVLVQARSLVFSICKVTSLLIDIAFNLLLMISPNSRDVATSRIVIGWAQLKQESSVVFDKLSDMFFDMIFSIGNLGPYLKQSYLSACGVINSAYLYAADFWCGLVVQQFPLFLGALRSIGAWMEVGFSVVNDVFTVILDDKIPDAVMDLYQYGYREYFQSAKYREKQAAYEERKEASLVNEKQGNKKLKAGTIAPDNRWLKNLGSARDKRMQRNTMATATSLLSALGPLGTVGGFIDLAITGKQLYDQIKLAQDIKEMLAKFPTSWTLFDFDDFYLSIDGLVEFLNADFTCYSMSVNVTPLQCTLLNFTEPSVDDVDLIAPRASVCWAEAQQRQVGVSNLYACTATSTCCSDPLNCDDTPRGVKLCSECPLPPAGVRTYGCNTMLQRCQCGVESFDVSRCSAQRDCGPSTSCSLLTSLDDVSFGALRSCTECSTSPVCLMGSSQQFGQCSCLTSTDSKVDLCSAAVGTRVSPAASKLCGFARDSGGYYSWSELSLVLCANALAPVCAEVMTETGALIYMAVSTRLRSGQVAYSSRRLLSVEDGTDPVLRLPSALLPDDPADDVTSEVIHRVVMESEWNHTSAPCSTLALAYRSGRELGPVDESTLHSCVYWRTVARQLIEEHGLVALRNFDTFLLSPGDLSASIGQSGVLAELLGKPWVLMHALLYSKWAKPVRAALVASHDANVSAVLRGWVAKARKLRKPRLPSELEELIDTGMQDGSNTSGRSGRRLMGLWEDTRDRLHSMPYYSLVRSSASNVTLLDTVRVAASSMWNMDAFFWKGVELDRDCPVVDSTASLVKQTMLVSKRYYAHLVEVNTPAVVRRRFKDVLPTAAAYNASLEWPADRRSIFNSLLDLLGVTVPDLMAFFSDPCPQDECMAKNRWTASYLVESALFCDLESVMFCTQHKNDLITSTVLMVLVYVALSLFLGYVGLTSLSTAFFVSIPLLVVWYSLGVSPRCFPMIPTCLLDDAVASFKSLLPAKVSMPRLLRVNVTHLRSCEELGFKTWEDPLTFAWCDLGFCEGMSDVSLLWDLSRWNFGTMHWHANGADADAYRVCASVTWTYTVPVMLLATVVFGAGAALVISLSSMLGPLVTLGWQIVLFDHLGN